MKVNKEREEKEEEKKENKRKSTCLELPEERGAVAEVVRVATAQTRRIH